MESGRRDGSDCGMRRLLKRAGRRRRRRSSQVVVVGGPDGELEEAKERLHGTRWQLGQVGRQQTAVAPSAGVVALAAQVQLLRSERGFPGWVFSDGAAFGAW